MTEWTLDTSNGNYYTLLEETNTKIYGTPTYNDLIYVGGVSYSYPVGEEDIKPVEYTYKEFSDNESLNILNYLFEQELNNND